MKKLVEILWTGGYDSTFRIVQLSRLPIEIQPYYLSDNRKSESNELNAIKNITEELLKHKSTKATFKPLIIIDMKERIENTKITKAFKNVLKNDFFGSQYEWLGCFAMQHPGIELAIHKDDKAIIIINKYGKLIETNDKKLGKNFVVDTKNSNKDIITLFENYHLPLANLTKLDMKKYYKENGYKKVMKMTWFCHDPINNKPCGRCNPCKYTIEEGMSERLPKIALLRYYYHCIKKSLKKN